MSSVSLHVSLRCGACGVVVPVNGLAPEATCWSCDKHTPIGDNVWSMLLREPLAEAKTLAPQVQRAATLNTDIGVIHRVFHTGSPHCGACQATIEGASFTAALGQRASAVPCTSCRQPVSVRAPTPELSAQGVAAIAAETEGVQKKRAPVPLACTKCGGGLHVDGSEKLITCPFCNNQQYLPNELLLALRATPVRPWSLVMVDGAISAPVKTLATWNTVEDVVIDANGNLYVWGLALSPSSPAEDGHKKSMAEIGAELGGMLGMDGTIGGKPVTGGDGGWSLFCMAPDLTLRWKLDGLAFAPTARLAWARSGHIIIRDGEHAEVRRCETGALVLQLALGGLSQLVVDADGSLVAWSFDDGVLRRFDATGHPTAMWGAMWGAGPPQATNQWVPYVADLQNMPWRAQHAILATGWDGNLYLQSSLGRESTCHLAAFDRSGRHLYTAAIPTGASSFEVRPAIDGYGRAYVHLPNDGGSVYRVDRGRAVIPFARSRSVGGLLGNERHIVCAPDGSLFALGENGCLRHFSPDGRVVFLSPAAIRADQ